MTGSTEGRATRLVADIESSYTRLLSDRPAWYDDAACRGMDPNIFHPDTTDRVNLRRRQNDAKAICRKCPVAASCLERALANDEDEGIWGGTDATERRRLRAATKVDTQCAM